MTDKEIEEKKKEFIDKFSTTIIREWQPYKVYNTSDKDLDKVWQWIEEVIRHYYTQGKIEGYKECLEEIEIGKGKRIKLSSKQLKKYEKQIIL